MGNLSVRSKFALLLASMLVIFLLALLAIRQAGNQVADRFNEFYNGHFLAAQQFEQIKAAQVDIALNIRGLQIAYLLSLSKQIPGYLESIEANYQATPKLLQQLQNTYTGPKEYYQQLIQLTQAFHEKARAFVQAMEESPDNKAPYPVFLAFSDAHKDLTDFTDEFSNYTQLAAAQGQQETADIIQQSSITFYGSLVLAVLLAFALGGWISAHIVRRIQVAHRSADNLAQGKLDVVANLDGSDELSNLAGALNRTAAQLQTVIRAIRQSAENVGHNSDSVMASNQRVEAVVDQITDHMAQVVTAIEEMSATAQDIAANTNDSASATREISSQAGQGLDSSRQTVQSIHSLVSALADTSNDIEHLRHETGNIERILDVIHAISEQTNLLALNAAIEAARAGEQGRGFAVVADEVRTLAQRSQNSVNEIETLLSNLNQASEQVVERMSSSSAIAGSARQQVDENNQMIELVLQQQVERVNNQTQQIATAAEQQSAVAHEISQNVHHVQQLSEETASIVASTNEAGQQMRAASKQVIRNLDEFTEQT